MIMNQNNCKTYAPSTPSSNLNLEKLNLNDSIDSNYSIDSNDSILVGNIVPIQKRKMQKNSAKECMNKKPCLWHFIKQNY